MSRWLFVVSFGACVWLVAGCSVDLARNPGARCTTDGDCTGGGTCHRGFCVDGTPPSDSGVDARMIDANADAFHVDANSDSGADAFVADANEPDAFRMACTSATDCGDDGDPCNGTETCDLDGFCDYGTVPDEGTLCDRDGMTSTRELCIDAACQPTQCGDGFTDPMNMEVCDDGNDVLGDGCDDCRYSCTVDGACVDENECDGAEFCDTTVHSCRSGLPLGDGMDCRGGRGTCMGDECIPDSCTVAADCDDTNECNGVETCDGATMLCVPGVPMDCGDGDSCTMDTCMRGLGCAHVLMDEDMDGVGPTACGGGDCDDMNPLVYPGAPESCDTIDNNCVDGITDQVDFWYADCDEDGYAVMSAEVGHSCSGPPSMAPAICVAGGWTAREPTADPLTRDCNDGNSLVNPGQTTYQTTPIPGASAAVDFDYDCDMSEERRSTSVGVCSGTLGICSLTQGWQGSVAGCGVEAQWITACSGTLCSVGREPRVQGCL